MINHQKRREKFKPEKIKILFIAESPPKNQRNYFYHIEEDQGNYSFFQNIILAILKTKYRGDIKEKKKLLNLYLIFLIEG
jgi:hypothetical protein